jgi:hypothetical protein
MAGSEGMMMMMMMVVMMMMCCCVGGLFLVMVAGTSASDDSSDETSDESSDAGTDKDSGGVAEGKAYIASASCDKKEGKWHRLLSLRSDQTSTPIMFCKKQNDLTVWNLKKVDKYYYRLQNVDTGNYLAARVGSWSPTMVASADTNAHWVLKRQDDGTYAILNRKTRQYLVIFDNVCDRFDSNGTMLRVDKLKVDSETAVPEGARWKIGQASGGWSRFISSSDSC